MAPIEIMKQAAFAAGKLILENYGKVKFEVKKDSSLVSQVDKGSEKLIKGILLANFPHYGFIGEESGTSEEKEYMWVVDPLDGTTNYKAKIPFFNVSIALARHKKPIAAVVFAPLTKELYHAELGKGAYLNGKPIKVSKEEKFRSGIIAFCHSAERVGEATAVYANLKRLNNKLRQVGAAALELAYVAAGRFDGFYMIGVHLWDVAAGQLLVAEAGGKVTDFKDLPFTIDSNNILASNGLMHKELLELLQKS